MDLIIKEKVSQLLSLLDDEQKKEEIIEVNPILHQNLTNFLENQGSLSVDYKINNNLSLPISRELLGRVSLWYKDINGKWKINLYKINQLFLLFISLIFLIGCNRSSDESSEQNNYPEKIYDGTIVLKTQIEIDDFGRNNYTKITGSLSIIGDANSQKIKDLSPLKSIKFIGSRLSIMYNPELNSLKGLNSLEKVGEKIYISGNTNLTNIQDLNKLSEIGNFFYISQNYKLTNLNGIDKISYLSGLYLIDNTELQTLSGLENLIKIEKNLEIKGNVKLRNFCPIKNALNNHTVNTNNISGNFYNPTIIEIKNGNCSK